MTKKSGGPIGPPPRGLWQWRGLNRNHLAGLRRGHCRLAEADRAVVHERLDLVALGEAAEEHLLGERVLDESLYRAAERPGAVVRVVALARQQLLHVLADVERQPLRGELLVYLAEHQIHDLVDLVPGQRV